MAGADATVVIVIERTKQRLREAGALSEDSAKPPTELALSGRGLTISAAAGVSSTSDGTYCRGAKQPGRRALANAATAAVRDTGGPPRAERPCTWGPQYGVRDHGERTVPCWLPRWKGLR